MILGWNSCYSILTTNPICEFLVCRPVEPQVPHHRPRQPHPHHLHNPKLPCIAHPLQVHHPSSDQPLSLHHIPVHSNIAPPQMHHTSQVHITTPTVATQPQGRKRKGWSHQRLWRLLRMHPDTWKQSNMLEVNHLCKVQGNEESKK